MSVVTVNAVLAIHTLLLVLLNVRLPRRHCALCNTRICAHILYLVYILLLLIYMASV